MKLPCMLLGAAMAAALSVTLAAQQQAPVGYHSITCVKVNPGQWGQAEAWTKGNGRKLDEAMVESGKVAGEIAMQNVLPGGDKARCDYLFVTFYKGLPLEPMTSAEMQEMLQKAGIGMTVEQLYAKYGEMGKAVFSHILQSHGLVGGAKEGDYLVFNEMKTENARECVDYQLKVWRPLAEQMVKDGETAGWAVNTTVFPWGDKDGYAVSSVDIYPSWDSVFKTYESISDGWKKVHPDMDISTTMGNFSKMCPIQHTTLYKMVSVVMPKM